jgi:hypothetical protein
MNNIFTEAFEKVAVGFAPLVKNPRARLGGFMARNKIPGLHTESPLKIGKGVDPVGIKTPDPQMGQSIKSAELKRTPQEVLRAIKRQGNPDGYNHMIPKINTPVTPDVSSLA